MRTKAIRAQSNIKPQETPNPILTFDASGKLPAWETLVYSQVARCFRGGEQVRSQNTPAVTDRHVESHARRFLGLGAEVVRD